MNNGIRSLATANRDTAAATAELLAQLNGMQPAVIVFFASHQHDGAALSRRMKQQYPKAQVIGCTTAGEFSERGTMNGGVTALALSSDKIAKAAATLVRYDSEAVDQSVMSAARSRFTAARSRRLNSAA